MKLTAQEIGHKLYEICNKDVTLATKCVFHIKIIQLLGLYEMMFDDDKEQATVAMKLFKFVASLKEVDLTTEKGKDNFREVMDSSFGESANDMLCLLMLAERKVQFSIFLFFDDKLLKQKTFELIEWMFDSVKDKFKSELPEPPTDFSLN